MLYFLFLTLTLADGSQIIEAKGAAGPTWEDCIKYASYVQYQQLYPRSQKVVKRQTSCIRL